MTEEIQDPFKRLFKFAGDYAMILGAYVAFFFFLGWIFPDNGLVNLLNFVGFLFTPLICYLLAKNYRDRAWGGYIRFGQVWSFGILLFFFAALIMSVLLYVRFEFVQPTAIEDAMKQFIQILQQTPQYPQENIDRILAFGTPTTIQIVLANLWCYIIGGGFLFLILSPMIARNRPNLPSDGNQYRPYQDNQDSDPKTKA